MVEDILNIGRFLNLEIYIPVDAAIGHIVDHKAEGRSVELFTAVYL